MEKSISFITSTGKYKLVHSIIRTTSTLLRGKQKLTFQKFVSQSPTILHLLCTSTKLIFIYWIEILHFRWSNLIIPYLIFCLFPSKIVSFCNCVNDTHCQNIHWHRYLRFNKNYRSLKKKLHAELLFVVLIWLYVYCIKKKFPFNAVFICSCDECFFFHHTWTECYMFTLKACGQVIGCLSWL